ncbi:hypothetical protein [Dyadobacter sp. CY343]|uniref:hypothetical protein n=1 Tax=Dyadobacter sp. CY343 TaxID=2907299 RepID=UPI001F179D30|nr:hypothetical protein [Dyadobacter sp. CY343]MCE7061242.1 hypothetical protein [Dyadobacter sp. CY343]
MATKQTIKRKVAMASIRSDDAAGKPSVHSIKYTKLDGTIGFKKRVSKSFQHLPGARKFRGNINTNHEFLFKNHDATSELDKHFRIKIDLLVEVDGMTVDHTNGEHKW